MKLKSVVISSVLMALIACFSIYYISFVFPSFHPPLFHIQTDDRPTPDRMALDVNSMAVYPNSKNNMLVFVEYLDDYCFANMIAKRNEAFFLVGTEDENLEVKVLKEPNTARMLFRSGDVIKVNIPPGVASKIGERAYYDVGRRTSKQLVIEFWTEVYTDGLGK